MAGNPRGDGLLAVLIFLTAASFIIVALRVYIRAFIVRSFGWDDWTIVASMICNLALTFSVANEIHYGLGQHISELSVPHIINVFKSIFAAQILYFVTLGLTKTSILIQYLRIFASTPTMRRACQATLVFVVAYTVEAVLLTVFTCAPVSAFWDILHKGKCIDAQKAYTANGSINVITDFVILLLPMPVFHSLKMSSREKFALIGIFALGSFACITSVLRLTFVIKTFTLVDVTHNSTEPGIYTAIEVSVAIISASLPALKVILQRIFPRLLQGSTHEAALARSRAVRVSVYAEPTRSQEDIELSGAPHSKKNSVTVKEHSILSTAESLRSGSWNESDNSHTKPATVISRQESHSGPRYAGSDAQSIAESQRHIVPAL